MGSVWMRIARIRKETKIERDGEKVEEGSNKKMMISIGYRRKEKKIINGVLRKEMMVFWGF